MGKEPEGLGKAIQRTVMTCGIRVGAVGMGDTEGRRVGGSMQVWLMCEHCDCEEKG